MPQAYIAPHPDNCQPTNRAAGGVGATFGRCFSGSIAQYIENKGIDIFLALIFKPLFPDGFSRHISRPTLTIATNPTGRRGVLARVIGVF